jgi:hypothetical protein
MSGQEEHINGLDGHQQNGKKGRSTMPHSPDSRSLVDSTNTTSPTSPPHSQGFPLKVTTGKSRQRLRQVLSQKTVISFLGVLALSLHSFLFSTRNLVPYLLSDNSNEIDSAQQRIESSARRLAPCLFNSTAVCQYDKIGQFLEDNPTIPNVLHRQIQAVPSYRRTPHAMANNRTYILRSLTLFPDNSTQKDATLNEYNPTILPLYKNGPNGTIISDFDQKLLDELTGRYHPDFSDAEADQVQYLTVTRSSNRWPGCVPGSFKKNGRERAYNWVNYPGLALLDSNLEPIDGADVLIDIEKYYFTQRNTRVLQDFTIFAARTTETNRKKDHLFLMSNGMHVLPLAIRRVPPGIETDDSDWETKINRPRIPQDTMYGTGLQIRMTHPGRRGGRAFSYTGQDRSVLIDKGKNMHIYESTNGTTYIEVWPHSNHTVKAANFFWDSFTSFKDYKWQLNQEQVSARDLRGASFPKPDRLKMKTPENRGTGCCADFALPDGRKVKLGIGHSVTRDRTYLHRFYAFLPEKPFPVITLSGLFCLGQMATTDRDSKHHWISSQDGAFKPQHTRIGLQLYNCPKVTFATGITNMIGHGDNYIIISYGVDDCYSRSIIVHKKKIEMLMFQDFLNTTQGSSE